MYNYVIYKAMKLGALIQWKCCLNCFSLTTTVLIVLQHPLYSKYLGSWITLPPLLRKIQNIPECRNVLFVNLNL